MLTGLCPSFGAVSKCNLSYYFEPTMPSRSFGVYYVLFQLKLAWICLVGRDA